MVHLSHVPWRGRSLCGVASYVLSVPSGREVRPPCPLLGHQGSRGDPPSCRGEKTTFPRKVCVCGFSKKPPIRFPHPSRIHGFTFVPLPLPFVPRSWCQDYFELKAEAQRSLLRGACLRQTQSRSSWETEFRKFLFCLALRPGMQKSVKPTQIPCPGHFMTQQEMQRRLMCV